MTSQTNISSIGEFGLIERIRKILGGTIPGDAGARRIIMGISDDAAVYRPSEGKVQVVSTDAYTEGIHFDLTFTSMKHLGWKVMAASLSDIAAMGALPLVATVAITLPAKITVEMVEELYRGIAGAARTHSCAVAGGDTTASAGNMSVAVTVIGEAEEGRILYRRGAVPGDYLCVTGHLGSSLAALKVLRREKERYLSSNDSSAFRPDLEAYAPALGKYFMPRPRFDIVQLTAGKIRVNSMIDISDGLSSEVHHLCTGSGAGAEVYERNLPVDGITQRIASEFGEHPTDYALFGGDEYELLFTLSDGEFGKLEALTGDVSIVGRIVEEEKGISYVREDGTTAPLPMGGWDHFSSKEETYGP